MHAGPALYVRIAHRFGPRQTEWMLAAITALWGSVLLLPIPTMDGNAWIIFRALWPEVAWGYLMLALGLLRIGGLIVNGARKNVTPWIRVATAAAGFLIWTGISTGFALAGVVSVWIAVYPTFAIWECVNIIRAARDAGESDALT